MKKEKKAQRKVRGSIAMALADVPVDTKAERERSTGPVTAKIL
jgi:hypothetical protein